VYRRVDASAVEIVTNLWPQADLTSPRVRDYEYNAYGFAEYAEMWVQ
jgi:hypothetical protein